MSGLVEFLRARLDEDEATARAADGGPSWRSGGPSGCGCCERIDAGGFLVGEVDRPNALHMIRHDPARVLAEVEAKREIVDRCAAVGYAMPSSHLAQGILATLALPYADHPDYREEWKP